MLKKFLFKLVMLPFCIFIVYILYPISVLVVLAFTLVISLLYGLYAGVLEACDVFYNHAIKRAASKVRKFYKDNWENIIRIIKA